MHRGILSACVVLLSESVGMCHPLDPPFFTSGTPSGWVYGHKNTPIGYHFFKIEMSKARYYGVDKPIQVSMSQHKTAVTPLR